MYGQTIKSVEEARQVLKTQGYFVDNLWHVDDIHFICEEKGYPELSDSEAMSIFFIANQNFDGEVGLGWPQLEREIVKYIVRKKFGKEIESLGGQEII